MNHKKCGGNIVVDTSSMFVIRSRGIKICQDGIKPGIIQIDYANKPGISALACSKCNRVFNTEREIENEVEEVCLICEKAYPPSQIEIISNSNNIPVCIHCTKEMKNPNTNMTPTKTRMINLYGSIYKSSLVKNLLQLIMSIK
jgi:hypothetical protein